MSENRKKTVLITGAGQGIGQAIAFRFAAGGSNIVIVSKDSAAQIQETVEGIHTAGGEVLAREIDVRNTGRTNSPSNPIKYFDFFYV